MFVIYRPGVSVGFDLLEQLAEFLGPQAAVLGTVRLTCFCFLVETIVGLFCDRLL